MKLLSSIAIGAVALCVTACNSKKTVAVIEEQPVVEVVKVNRPSGGNGVQALPKAVVYKTNGDFIHNVPVTLSADRKEIVSYPAPSDITENSLPVVLDNGYLLDRRGVNGNSAFLKFTYKEYSELKQAPSIKELKEMIIGGAEVIELVVLPMTLEQALGDISRCNKLVDEKFPGCDVVVQRRAIQLTPQ